MNPDDYQVQSGRRYDSLQQERLESEMWDHDENDRDQDYYESLLSSPFEEQGFESGSTEKPCLEFSHGGSVERRINQPRTVEKTGSRTASEPTLESIDKNKDFSTLLRRFLERNVDRVVARDSRTRILDRPFGFDKQYIRQEVLEKGRTDFERCTIGGLTVEDKVNLYAHMNMKLHLYHLQRSFRLFRNWLDPVFSESSSAQVIDIGCGPGTACFALADLFSNSKFNYAGIDIASPMRAKAVRLLKAARESGFSNFNVEGVFRSWEDIQVRPKEKIFINCSYFFSSKSLDDRSIASLVRCVNQFVENNSVKSVQLLYLNPARQLSGKNYTKFKRQIEIKDSCFEEFSTVGSQATLKCLAECLSLK